MAEIDVDALADHCVGRVLDPHDPELPGELPGVSRPGAVVVALCAEDVAAAAREAARAGRPLVLWPARADDGAVLVSLDRLGGLWLGEDTARVEAGVRWADLPVPRRHGADADRVVADVLSRPALRSRMLSADVVTADGALLRLSGERFGPGDAVVTALELRL